MSIEQERYSYDEAREEAAEIQSILSVVDPDTDFPSNLGKEFSQRSWNNAKERADQDNHGMAVIMAEDKAEIIGIIWDFDIKEFAKFVESRYQELLSKYEIEVSLGFEPRSLYPSYSYKIDDNEISHRKVIRCIDAENSRGTIIEEWLAGDHEEAKSFIEMLPTEAVDIIEDFSYSDYELVYALHIGAISQEEFNLINHDSKKAKCYNFRSYKHPPTQHSVQLNPYSYDSAEAYYGGEIKVWAIVDEPSDPEN